MGVVPTADLKGNATTVPTATERKSLARLGYAMPDGSYYIRAGAVGADDLQNAIDSVGRATGQDGDSDEQARDAVRRHIIKRAADLKLSSKIPDTWNSDGTLKHSDEDESDDDSEVSHDAEDDDPEVPHDAEDDDIDDLDDLDDTNFFGHLDDELDDAYFDHLDDDGFGDYLEHHGVKGMKWGVRHQRQLELYNRVANGTGSKIDKLRIHNHMSVIDHIKHKGSAQSFAKAGAAQLQAMKDRVQSGNATRRDKINLALAYSGEDAVRSVLKKPRVEHSAMSLSDDIFDDEDEYEFILVHHGVKGMKWGVRKDRGHEEELAKTKVIAKADQKFERSANKTSTFIVLHNRAAELMNDHDIDRINNKPQYKDADFTYDSPLRQRYYTELSNAFIKNLNRAAKEHGTNASGTKQYKINANPDGTWHVTTTAIQHATNTPDSFTVYPQYDSKGHVVKINMSQDSVHHMLDDGDDLEHHGVKGMHWGVRKDEEIHPDYTPGMRVRDRQKFGTGGVRRINHRMHNGASATEARVAEKHYQKNRNLAIVGGLVATRMLAVHGPVAIQKTAVRADRKREENTIKETLKRNETLKSKKNRQGVHKITTL